MSVVSVSPLSPREVCIFSETEVMCLPIKRLCLSGCSGVFKKTFYFRNARDYDIRDFRGCNHLDFSVLEHDNV
jgi:hypothetical protein